MELTRVSEWFDGESGYIPQVGSDVIMQPIIARQDWLIIRFMDHLGLRIELHLNPSNVDRIIVYVKTQRYLKKTNGAGIHYHQRREECPSDAILSAFSEWFDECGGEIADTDIDVRLIDIKVKIEDHLSADIMNPENALKEYYLLEFRADDDGMQLDILLSRIDIDRIIFFEESRRFLSGG